MSEYIGYICDLNYSLKIHSKTLTEATKIETDVYNCFHYGKDFLKREKIFIVL